MWTPNPHILQVDPWVRQVLKFMFSFLSDVLTYTPGGLQVCPGCCQKSALLFYRAVYNDSCINRYLLWEEKEYTWIKWGSVCVVKTRISLQGGSYEWSENTLPCATLLQISESHVKLLVTVLPIRGKCIPLLFWWVAQMTCKRNSNLVSKPVKKSSCNCCEDTDLVDT